MCQFWISKWWYRTPHPYIAKFKPNTKSSICDLLVKPMHKHTTVARKNVHIMYCTSEIQLKGLNLVQFWTKDENVLHMSLEIQKEMKNPPLLWQKIKKLRDIFILFAQLSKVEKILKRSLDFPSPSPSMKIMGRKICLGCKDKTLLGVANKLLKTKSLLPSPSNVLPYHLK